ncbi:MAG: Enoyl-CoA hydratase/carnithine racemase, partial [Acidimicrobiales bacterium]|nr:Enoyl-CoA hydratase/carnithine racemase [Acidimicrobiales bacterium]
MTGTVHVDIEGRVAVLTNDNPEKHNAFDDEMDAQLFEILGSIPASVRAIVWRGEGKSWSS